MKRAQRAATRENARFGMSLILDEPRSRRKAPSEARKPARTAPAKRPVVNQKADVV